MSGTRPTTRVCPRPPPPPTRVSIAAVLGPGGRRRRAGRGGAYGSMHGTSYLAAPPRHPPLPSRSKSNTSSVLPSIRTEGPRASHPRRLTYEPQPYPARSPIPGLGTAPSLQPLVHYIHSLARRHRRDLLLTPPFLLPDRRREKRKGSGSAPALDREGGDTETRPQAGGIWGHQILKEPACYPLIQHT